LNSAFQNILDGAEDWEVYSSFSGVPKYTGKKNVSLTEDDIKSAEIKTGMETGILAG
jgi:hypothetical protein